MRMSIYTPPFIEIINDTALSNFVGLSAASCQSCHKWFVFLHCNKGLIYSCAAYTTIWRNERSPSCYISLTPTESCCLVSFVILLIKNPPLLYERTAFVPAWFPQTIVPKCLPDFGRFLCECLTGLNVNFYRTVCVCVLKYTI